MKNIFFFVVFILVPLLTISCGPYGHMREWDRMENYGCGFGFGYGGMFMWVIFLIVLGVALYFIIQAAKSKNVIGQAQDTPLDILKKRYAKGEITKEEFDRMKKELE